MATSSMTAIWWAKAYTTRKRVGSVNGYALRSCVWFPPGFAEADGALNPTYTFVVRESWFVLRFYACFGQKLLAFVAPHRRVLANIMPSTWRSKTTFAFQTDADEQKAGSPPHSRRQHRHPASVKQGYNGLKYEGSKVHHQPPDNRPRAR